MGALVGGLHCAGKLDEFVDWASTLTQLDLVRLMDVSLSKSGVIGAERVVARVREILGESVTVEVARRSELHTFAVMPQRWIVERSFAWLEKNRRLWKNCERWLNTSLQFVHLAFLGLLLRRL